MVFIRQEGHTATVTDKDPVEYLIDLTLEGQKYKYIYKNLSDNLINLLFQFSGNFYLTDFIKTPYSFLSLFTISGYFPDNSFSSVRSFSRLNNSISPPISSGFIPG